MSKSTRKTDPAPTVGLGSKRVPNQYRHGDPAEVASRPDVRQDTLGRGKAGPSSFRQVPPAASRPSLETLGTPGLRPRQRYWEDNPRERPRSG